jgi:integrase
MTYNNYEFGLKTFPVNENEILKIISNKKTINSIHCDIWTLIDEESLNSIEVNWKNVGISPQRECALKEFLRGMQGAGESASGPLYGREKTIKNRVFQYKIILNSIDANYGTDIRLDQLTIEHVRKIFSDIITKEDGSLWAYGTAQNYSLLFSQSNVLYDKGLITDGFNCELPKSSSILLMIKSYVESKGFLFHEWAIRGSWNNLSIDVALIALSEQIKILESPVVKFLLDYFEFQRSEYRVHPDNVYTHSWKILKTCKEVNKRKLKGITKERSNIERLANIFLKHGFLTKNNEVSKAFYTRMFKENISKIKKSASYVFLALSGIRASELASIRYSNFRKINNTWVFDSKDYKSNKGFVITRPVSNHGYNAIKIASLLSYHSPNLDVSPSSTKTTQRKHFDFCGDIKKLNVSKETVGKSVTAAYEQAMNEIRDKIPNCPTTTSPHALRHIFAAIALRTFSGDVRDHIRRHFAHGIDSSFTRNYVENKLNDAIVSATETEFFVDFVSMIGGTDTDFYAAIAKRIREKVRDEHRFTTLDELSTIFSSETINACEVIGHEFGYSIPWDSDDIDTTSLDVHHLSNSSSVEDAMRIGISHQHFMDTTEDPLIKKSSFNVINMCEALIKDLNVDIGDLTYD